MPETLPMHEARQQLTSLPERLDLDPAMGAIAVTRHGKPVLAIMSWDLYEAIIETLDIVGDPALASRLRLSIQEAAAGQTLPWSQVKSDLGL
jgi:antitoxin YefM